MSKQSSISYRRWSKVWTHSFIFMPLFLISYDVFCSLWKAENLAWAQEEAVLNSVIDLRKNKDEKLQEVVSETQSELEISTDRIQHEVTDAQDKVKAITDEAGVVVTDVKTDIDAITDEFKDSVSNVKEVTSAVNDLASAPKELLTQEIEDLKAQLNAVRQSAAQVSRGKQGYSPISWNVEVNPNLDGSLSLLIGGDRTYLSFLSAGLTYSQVRRTQRDQCDRFATNSCKAYAEIRDDMITLKGLGFTTSLGDHFKLSLNLNGLYLRQTKEGTSVDIELKRYEDVRGQLTSLQLNTQVQLQWRMSDDIAFIIQGSGSPYYKSVETEEGFDSGLVVRSSETPGRIGNDNNMIYTGQLGTYNKRFNMETSFFDGSLELYMRDLLSKSDVSFNLTGRYLSYGAVAERSVIYNGDVINEVSNQNFKRIDLFTNLSFELAFLGFEPLNPMFGLSYTYSRFEGIRDTTIDQSMGVSIRFSTSPLD